jgi:hypothetical protein
VGEIVRCGVVESSAVESSTRRDLGTFQITRLCCAAESVVVASGRRSHVEPLTSGLRLSANRMQEKPKGWIPL